MENYLVQLVLCLESWLFGMTTKVGFEIAETDRVDYNFGMEKRIAGRNWKDFKIRHPENSS